MKGQKTGGREKGTPNKTTKTAREWLTELIDKNREQIEKDFKALDPKDRLAILEKLMSYTIPKVSSMQVNFNQMTDEQLNLFISELSKNIHDNEN